MARTNTYKRQVAAKITTVNRKLRDIERTFGTDSEQYQRYINATTAALPPDAYTLTASGRLTIHRSKENIETLKLGQLKPLSKLPTAKRSMDQSKKSIAQNKLRAAGVQSLGAEEITQQARLISDEEALAELAAKTIIQGMENEKGKLKYSEEAKADMKEKGAKTYRQLLDILQRGAKREAKKEYMREYRQRNKERRAEYQREYRQRNKERRAEYQREYRSRNREEVNRKQREYRSRNREEVNRKQREYRARKAAEKRLAEQTAERERRYDIRRRT